MATKIPVTKIAVDIVLNNGQKFRYGTFENTSAGDTAANTAITNIESKITAAFGATPTAATMRIQLTPSSNFIVYKEGSNDIQEEGTSTVNIYARNIVAISKYRFNTFV